jgi:hypothetical protein
MLGDGVKETGRADTLAVRDLAEVLRERLADA